MPSALSLYFSSDAHIFYSLVSLLDGFMLCLLGSDKPIIESLQPNDVDQTEALENQFQGMSDIPLSYDDYVAARAQLLELVNGSLTDTDREFLISFESGTPNWELCCKLSLRTVEVAQYSKTEED